MVLGAGPGGCPHVMASIFLLSTLILDHLLRVSGWRWEMVRGDRDSWPDCVGSSQC